MAGLKQVELAKLAGLHVNSLKRLERMKVITGSEHSAGWAAAALAKLGIVVTRDPPCVGLSPKRHVAPHHFVRP
jgi:hypothetical protein